jgi:hypothetical protein
MWLRPNLTGVLVTMLSLTIGGLDGTRSAQAAPATAVSIAEVKISVDAGIDGDVALELGRALRVMLDDELKRVAATGRPRRPLIVSATITRFSSERRAEASKASATVSLALLRADDRVLFAELNGRASVEETSGNLATLRSAALRRAAQRAMARLPEAMQHCG